MITKLKYNTMLCVIKIEYVICNKNRISYIYTYIFIIKVTISI